MLYVLRCSYPDMFCDIHIVLRIIHASKRLTRQLKNSWYISSLSRGTISIANSQDVPPLLSLEVFFTKILFGWLRWGHHCTWESQPLWGYWSLVNSLYQQLHRGSLINIFYSTVVVPPRFSSIFVPLFSFSPCSSLVLPDSKVGGEAHGFIPVFICSFSFRGRIQTNFPPPIFCFLSLISPPLLHICCDSRNAAQCSIKSGIQQLKKLRDLLALWTCFGFIPTWVSGTCFGLGVY